MKLSKRIKISITIVSLSVLLTITFIFAHTEGANIVVKPELSSEPSNTEVLLADESDDTKPIAQNEPFKRQGPTKPKLAIEDFTINYNGFTINEDTTVGELIDNLGYGDKEDYYYNNSGYVSTIGDTQVFNLCYPNYENTELRVVYHKKVSGDDSFISFIELYFETPRGIKAGDSEQHLVEVYGEPDEIKLYNGFKSYFYYFGEKSTQIVLDGEGVKYLLIEFRNAE
ncbi:MAG: hypothetical protein FWG53_11535 [Clostridiales bacterium]|nr:hypothetical protein [Clostridiales bacterium]